jgi:hypothetical protein
LERCANEFRRCAAVLEEASPPAAAVGAREPEKSESFLGLIVIGIFLAVFSFTNFWLLRIFFLEHLSAEPLRIGRILFTPGDVMAVLFPLAEIAAGFMLFSFHTTSAISPVVKTFYVAAWVTLIGLSFIEAIAYGILSKNANLAGSLGIDPRNILYLPVLYSFAIFGIAITFGLAGLTHAICTQVVAYRTWRIQRQHRRNADRGRKNLQLHADRVETLRGSLEALQKRGVTLVGDLRQQLGLVAEGEGKLALTSEEVDKAVRSVVLGKPLGPKANPGLAGHAIVYVLILIGWLAACALLFYLLLPFLHSLAIPATLSTIVAVAVPVIVTVAGHALTYGRRNLIETVDGVARPSLADFGWLLMIVLACLVAASAGVYGKGGLALLVVWAGLGFLSVLGIVACSTRLVDAFSVLPLLGFGLLTFVLIAVAGGAAVTALTLIGALLLCQFALTVLAVPGQTLRRQSNIGSEAT